MQMLTLACAALAGIAAAAPTAAPAVKQIMTLPNGVWAENLHVRPNGLILGSIATSPEIYQFNPFSGNNDYRIFHKFPGYTSCWSIDEVQPDVYYVSTGNFTFPTFTGHKDAWSVWEVDMRGVGNNSQLASGAGPQPKITKLLDNPNMDIGDGMTVLNKQSGLLISGDSGSTNGQLYVYNTNNGAITAPYAATPFANPPGGSSGIDGMKVRNSTLYYTNLSLKTLGRMPIDTSSGKSTGPIEVLYNGTALDDFYFDGVGNLYATVLEGNGIGYAQAPLKPGNLKFIATQIPSASAARFGLTPADKNTLYVTSVGNLSAYATGGPFTVPGGIWSVDTTRV